MNVQCFVSCGAVVMHGGKILLVRDKTGTKWGLPMGEPEAGETEEETAKREILEETGLTVHIKKGFRETAQFKYLRENKPAEKNMVIFCAETTTEKYSANNQELADIGWFDPKQLATLDVYPEARTIITKAVNYS